MRLTELAEQCLRKIGLDVHRYLPSSSPPAQLVASLRRCDIDLVLDLGANKSQFESEICQWGYMGRIASFEPLSQTHGQLRQSSMWDSMWDTCQQSDLGDHDGEVEINSAENSESSSILHMLEAR